MTKKFEQQSSPGGPTLAELGGSSLESLFDAARCVRGGRCWVTIGPHEKSVAIWLAESFSRHALYALPPETASSYFHRR